MHTCNHDNVNSRSMNSIGLIFTNVHNVFENYVSEITVSLTNLLNDFCKFGNKSFSALNH